MVNSVPAGWGKTAQGSFFGRRRARTQRHPDEFECGVRVVDGSVPGESERWTYRASAVDRLVGEDPLTLRPVITLNHGPDVRLRIAFTGQQLVGTGAVRRSHVVWPGVELTSGARIEVAAAADAADELRIPPS